jgi:hypothetical protein
MQIFDKGINERNARNANPINLSAPLAENSAMRSPRMTANVALHWPHWQRLFEMFYDSRLGKPDPLQRELKKSRDQNSKTSNALEATPLRDPTQSALDQFQELALRAGAQNIARSSESVVIPAPVESGFSISLIVQGGRYTATLGPWYDDFDTLIEAVGFLGEALQGNVRIRIDYCDDRFHQSVVERRQSDGAWLAVAGIKIISFQSRATTASKYLQNPMKSFDFGIETRRRLFAANERGRTPTGAIDAPNATPIETTK